MLGLYLYRCIQLITALIYESSFLLKLTLSQFWELEVMSYELGIRSEQLITGNCFSPFVDIFRYYDGNCRIN
ncbi:MAG: hypothetical protein WBA07_30195 [Rivularia sp. (in: cyanobacteria)]